MVRMRIDRLVDVGRHGSTALVVKKSQLAQTLSFCILDGIQCVSEYERDLAYTIMAGSLRKRREVWLKCHSSMLERKQNNKTNAIFPSINLCWNIVVQITMFQHRSRSYYIFVIRMDLNTFITTLLEQNRVRVHLMVRRPSSLGCVRATHHRVDKWNGIVIIWTMQFGGVESVSVRATVQNERVRNIYGRFGVHHNPHTNLHDHFAHVNGKAYIIRRLAFVRRKPASMYQNNGSKRVHNKEAPSVWNCGCA